MMSIKDDPSHFLVTRSQHQVPLLMELVSQGPQLHICTVDFFLMFLEIRKQNTTVKESSREDPACHKDSQADWFLPTSVTGEI